MLRLSHSSPLNVKSRQPTPHPSVVITNLDDKSPRTLPLGVELRTIGVVDVLAVHMQGHGDLSRLVDHAVDRIRLERHDVAGAKQLLALFANFGIAGPYAVIHAHPERVSFRAIDASDDRPCPVVVRWCAAPRQP